MLRKMLFALSSMALISGSAPAGGLEIGPNHSGLAIGNVREFTGLRFNFSDRNLRRIDGVNFTIWRAGAVPTGDVQGLALGVWGPEAENISGVSAGIVGVRAEGNLRGLAFGLAGVGSESDATGIFLGGLGIGAGESLTGLAIGGLGAGVGTDFSGIGIGGLGMGIGGSASGVIVAGLGAGIGENFTGIGVSLLGFGIGENATGIMASGLGFGVGENFTGIAAGGLGMGVGGTMSGIALGGLGLGVQESRGITMATFMVRGNEMHGFTSSAYNRFDDEMEGLAVGLLNITHELRGVQLGLLNIVWDNPRGRRILPLINWGS